MNDKNEKSYSNTRRDFLKNTSLISLMGMAIPELVLTWGCTSYAEEFTYSGAISLSLSLFRPEDFLYLHYSFVNARKVGNTIKKQKNNRPLFLRIQIPSQHIAEELVINPAKINSRKSSLLSGSSFLAFKARESKNGTAEIPIDINELLDWDKYFNLITIDDFFRSTENNGVVEKRIVNDVLDKFKDKDFFNDISHDNANDDIAWPITTFEIPYKMILSPLAPGLKNLGHIYREFGKHTFLDNIESILLEKKYERGIRKIIKPWENELFYQGLDGKLSPPRFKVIGYQCSADKLELLPYPDHRRQLHKLTMMPPPERDVVSEYFKISSLGGSTKLRYKNDIIPNNINATIVEWNQTIKYARDNYVSITFRAIDVFTGIKLLVSIVAERKFTNGKSYLLRRYYISYLEKEKTYEQPMHIGRMVFKQIIPKTEGHYFTPKQGESKENWYYVQKEDFNYSCKINGEHIRENDLEFEYIGIDKNNRSHRFKSKIIFIPAESYEIVADCGTYISKVNGVQCTYTSTQENIPISILHIGGLDPRNYVKTDCNETENEAQTLEDCEFSEAKRQVYKYTLRKIFNDENKICSIINQIAQEIDNKSLFDHFSITINNEFTYANIENIRFKSTNEEIALQEFRSSDSFKVLPESENSTFFTDSIFLFSTYCNSFVTDTPLTPFLHSAKLKISQIDQIEGQSKLRDVTLADDFFNLNLDRTEDFPSFDKDFSKDNIDEEPEIVDTRNPTRLLFKLIDVDKKLFNNSVTEVNTPNLITPSPLSGFFGENYRRAGAMSNLGITIAHISVLEKGIVYNPTHNQILRSTISDDENITTQKTSNVSVNLSTDSLFPGVDAEILGIPLLKIVEGSLPIDEIPEFNFIKEIRKSFLEIEKIVVELKDTYRKWKSRYDDRKETLVKEKEQLVKVKTRLKELETGLEDEIRTFLTFLQNIAEQYILRESYTIKLSVDYDDFLENLSRLFDSIINLLEEVDDQLKIGLDILINSIHSLIFFTSQDQKLDEILERTNLNFNSIIDTLIKTEKLDERHLAELVKIGMLKQFLSKESKSQSDALNTAANSIQVIAKIRKIGLQEIENYGKYYRSIESAIEEALQFSKQYVTSKKDETGDIERKIKYYSEELWSSLKSTFKEFLKKYKYPSQLVKEKIQALYPILTHYDQIRGIYDNIKEGHYRNMIEELKTLTNDKNLQWGFDSLSFEKSLICLSSVRLDELHYSKSDNITNFIENLRSKIYKLQKIEDSDNCNFLNDFDRPLKHYQNFVADYQEIIEEHLSDITIEKIFSEEIHKLKKSVRELEDSIKKKEYELKTYADGFIAELDAILKEEIDELKRNPDLVSAKRKIEEIYRIKEKLKEVSKQSLQHQFKTNKFKNADLAGGISFKANRNTSFTVDVNYEIEFDVTQLDRAPTISRQTFKTESALIEFKIGFLNLISIDFEKVSFINGSEVKDDFQVKIRDVEFDGLLRFVDGFKKYLKNLDRNLVFDITSDYANIGYNFPIGSFQLGAFNFYNLNLSAFITLPFDPNKSLQLKFGFGSPYSKFAITYLIFGGQGYFLIIAEPKRGIVGLEIVLEFGAIFYLDLPGGIARGEAYLVGGIYIKKYDGAYDIRGYILCVGRLNIISLFSASVTFYLGLRSYNGGLKGTCLVRVKKRFSKWFKIVVAIKMEKTISNPNSGQPTALNLKNSNNDIVIIDSNILNENYETLDNLSSANLTIKTPKKGSFELQLVTEDSIYSIRGVKHNTKVSRDTIISFDFESLKSKSINLDKSEIELRLLHSKENDLEVDIYEFNRKLNYNKPNCCTDMQSNCGFETSEKENDLNYISAYYA
ncbi:hypothetical protein FK220_002105 [Flavobacteriaceae bacterium TP-CH-4]|uniref:Uncharacterized protein n=1 Tax=Pelagihabitans pacificus TaxID=2696054 RepID=A0A967AQH7_9FLAO|nr:hypothetical protein [Pelagihabitans pacificus]NHF58117.1 hypothetical protein [Pelagihabitans pacificus]